MTNEHTAALKRARDSVRNAREILSSIPNNYWREDGLLQGHLGFADDLLSTAIDEESKT